jgi:MFS family permease
MRVSLRGMPKGAWPLLILFVLNGAMLSSWFVWIATVQRNLGLSDSELGNAEFGLPAGLLVGTFLSNVLMKRFGVRATVTWGVVLYCATLPLPGLASSGLWLALALGAGPGLFNGIMEPPAYLFADQLKRAWGGREIIGYMAAGFSAAQIVSPLIASRAIHWHVPVWAYLGGLGAVGVSVALVVCHRLPAADVADEEQHQSWRRPPRWWRWVLAVAVLCIAGFVVEGIWAEWHGVYLSGPGIGASLAAAALAYPVFQAAAVPSRLAQPGLVDRFGAVRVVIVSALVVLVGVGVIVSAHSLEAGLIGAVVVGLGAGPVAPIAFSAAGSDPKAVTLVGSLGYVGLTAGPPTIGHLAERVGLRHALLAMAAMAVVMLVTAFAASRREASGG